MPFQVRLDRRVKHPNQHPQQHASEQPLAQPPIHALQFPPPLFQVTEEIGFAFFLHIGPRHSFQTVSKQHHQPQTGRMHKLDRVANAIEER